MPASKRFYSSVSSSVYVSKCREAIRAKRPELKGPLPPICNDGKTQKTLIPYHVAPQKNSSLAINLPTSIFDSQSLSNRFEKEQKLETSVWVKAAYLHQYKAKDGKSGGITIKPFVEHFMRSGQVDPHLAYYLEKHKDDLIPIVRELSQKRNDILKHNTFGAVEKSLSRLNADDPLLAISENHVTLEDLKAAVQNIKKASSSDEQVAAVQKYMKLRRKYIQPESKSKSDSSSHLTSAETFKLQVEQEIKDLFNDIVVKQKDPAQHKDRIKKLKQDYSRLQKMSMPSEEIDLFDVYSLEKSIMNQDDAAIRFLKKNRPKVERGMKKKLEKFLREREKKELASKDAEYKKVRDAYRKSIKSRAVIEKNDPVDDLYPRNAYKVFMENHEIFLNGAMDIITSHYKQFKDTFEILKQLYQEKRKVTAASPFRHPSKTRNGVEAVDLNNLDIEKETEEFTIMQSRQRRFLENHYERCSQILPQEKLPRLLEDMEQIKFYVKDDETFTAAVKELEEIALDAANGEGLKEYNASSGDKQTFEDDLKYLKHLGDLSKHITRVNNLEAVFGVRSIDKSLEMLDEYNIALEPPRYRRYIKSSIPEYRLKTVDTYGSHPSKKQRPHDRKVVLTVTEDSLLEVLSRPALDRMVGIAGSRYNPSEKKLTLSSTIFQTKEENEQYVVNLLGTLIRESQRADLHSDYVLPEKAEKMTALEELALQYPRLEEEDDRSHELLSKWMGYLRRGRIAGADEIYGEGLDHESGVSYDVGQGKEGEVIDFNNVESLSQEEFERIINSHNQSRQEESGQEQV